jgi:glutamate synthase domain-containing protein 3
MTINVNFLLAEKQWIPLIGKFIVDFVSIEDSLHQVVKHHVRNTFIKSDWFLDRFEDQLQIFEAVMRKQILVKELDITNLSIFVENIKQLKQIRNLIAHNSLGLSFEENETGEMKSIGFTIDGKRKKSYSINFDKLLGESKRLSCCKSMLNKLMMKFHKNELKLTLADKEGLAALPSDNKSKTL